MMEENKDIRTINNDDFYKALSDYIMEDIRIRNEAANAFIDMVTKFTPIVDSIKEYNELNKDFKWNIL